MLRRVGVGELLFSKNNSIFWVGDRSVVTDEKEGLDPVLEEVFVANCAVMEALAKSGSGVFTKLA